MMKCFYHSADLDGICSGAIVKYKYPECEMHAINYGQQFPWDSINNDDVIIMVDFSLQPFDDMKKLNNCCKLLWLDHHESAIIDYNISWSTIAGVRTINKAACKITWEYLFPSESIPLAVELLSAYDIWDHKDYRTMPFQYGMRLYNLKDINPENITFWKSVFNSTDFFITDTIKAGKIILNYQKIQDESYARSTFFEVNISGFKAVAINKMLTNSQLFDSVYNTDKHDLMLAFGFRYGKWTISIYSTKDEINCGEIAKRFGGGGHKGAAGFQCVELPFKV